MNNLTPLTQPLSIIRDERKALPELYMDIYVADSSRYEISAFAKMFVPAMCSSVELPEDADLVVFTGGADVNPALYGEDPHSTTVFSDARDTADIEIYKICLDKGIPMLGICRGAQFLHVMNGGKLYQDIDNHNSDHTMYCHRTRRLLQRVSSVHHQACIRTHSIGMDVLATSAKATERWESPTKMRSGNFSDVEAFFYRDTMSLGIQGHPEYSGYDDFRQWTMETIQEMIIHCPDIKLEKGVYRIKPEVLEERNAKWAETVVVTPPNQNTN